MSESFEIEPVEPSDEVAEYAQERELAVTSSEHAEEYLRQLAQDIANATEEALADFPPSCLQVLAAVFEVQRRRILLHLQGLQR